MSISPHRLFKNSFEYIPAADWRIIPPYTRGIYVLYETEETLSSFNVVYIGMARGEASGVRGRIKKHFESKKNLWTHFSVFQVWDNIPAREVEELEGLFRHFYRFDQGANRLNVQKGTASLKAIRRKSASDWI